MDIKEVLLTNYLPYAKGTIIGRAIPSIDGLKPAQRRILYTMYTMGLINGSKTKSSNIVGQTMKLHPHGDMAIYETMVRMATGNESLNTPYVESKGNFGKVYSTDLAFAAPRYTEAKLAPICKEVFDGINEDAVDFTENFDNTMREPTLLPVKFPSILVNPSNGIAVGLSSSIPSFSLTNVCNSVIGMLRGTITDADSLMDVLGVPEFSTGGFVHADKAELAKLGKTGKGSFVVSGTVTTYPDRIEITEIPYRTSAEAIVAAIEENVKNGELKEVIGISDEIDLHGFKLVVQLKNRVNAKEVLRKLCRLTPLRMKISFNTQVIIGDRCEEIGLYSLLEKWIQFRLESINRVYTHRRDAAAVDEHLLSTWEKIKDDIRNVALMIASKSEREVVSTLQSQYELDDKQINYILDIKLRLLTQDNLNKKLKELNDKRNLIAECNIIIGSDNEKYKIIVSDLERIIKNYGTSNKTHQADPIVEEPEPTEVEKIDDSIVTVVLTKSGFLKRLVSLRDITSYELPEGEEEEARWSVRNNEYILVFTYSGEVHKILVNSIDASRGSLKDEVYKLVGLNNKESVMLIDSAGDYSKYFNLVYPNGRGTRVYYNRAAGKRKKYIGLFEKCEPGKAFFTFEDQFFMVTIRRKAAYCNLELMGMFTNRVAFKVARVGSGDRIVFLHPLNKVPDINAINLDRYKRDYTVLVGDDVLWEGARGQHKDEDESNENLENNAASLMDRINNEN